MDNEAVFFKWGHYHGTVLDKDWSVGDSIWNIGDCVADAQIPGGIGIVSGVVAREWVVKAHGKRIARFTYAIEVATK